MARRVSEEIREQIAAMWRSGEWTTYVALAERMGVSDKTVRSAVRVYSLKESEGRQRQTSKPCACGQEGCLIERHEGEAWHRFRDRKYRSPECHPKANPLAYNPLDFPKGGEEFLDRLEAVYGRWKFRPPARVPT